MYRLFILTVLCVIGINAAACSNTKPVDIVAVCEIENVVMGDNQVALPDIKVKYNNGGKSFLGMSGFWFVSEHCYVQDNKIFVKSTAPETFVDTVIVTLRSNSMITTAFQVEKIFVPLESVSLSVRNNSNKVIIGEDTQITSIFMPSNASDRFNVELVPLNENVEIEGNTVKVPDSIPVDTEIIIQSKIGEIVYGSITLTARERIAISNAADLANIEKQPDEDYILVNNIDNFSGIISRFPINSFSGTLKGNGYTISNFNLTDNSISIPKSNRMLGLFGALTGTIEDINFTDCRVFLGSCHDGSGWAYVGIVAGYISPDGIVKNISLTDCEVQSHRNRSEAGGISGTCDGTITDITITRLYLVGNGDLGGVSGGLTATVNNSNVMNSLIQHWTYSIGADTGVRNIGGIVGFNNGGTIQYSNVLNYTGFVMEGTTKFLDMSDMRCVGIIVGTQSGGKLISIRADTNCANYDDIGKVGCYLYAGEGGVYVAGSGSFSGSTDGYSGSFFTDAKGNKANFKEGYFSVG